LVSPTALGRSSADDLRTELDSSITEVNMTQAEVDERVAAAIGEDINEVRRRGFHLADQPEMDYDSQPRPLVVDWDQLDQRVRIFP
jgi:hypothetical protein